MEKKLEKIIDGMKKKESRQEKLMKEYSGDIVSYIYTMLFTNQVACVLINDLDIYFKEDGIFKRDIKKDLKLIKDTSIKFEDRMLSVYGDKEDYFVVSFQKMMKEVKPSLDLLFFAIEKEVMSSKHKISIGRLEQAISITSLACLIREERINKLQEISTLFPKLEYLDMNTLLKMLNKLAEKVNRGISVNLNDSVDCTNAFKVVMNKLTDQILTTRIINEEQ